MRKILEKNPVAVRIAGETLAEIAALLQAGDVDQALAKLEDARRGYSEWDELDRVTQGVEQLIEHRKKMATVERVVLDLVGGVLGIALRRLSPQ